MNPPLPVPGDGPNQTQSGLLLLHPFWKTALGQTCKIVKIAGCDTEGCPLATIRRDTTGVSGSVRIRDLYCLDEPRLPLCQDTGMRASQTSYGYLRVGSTVRIHKHRAVNGEMNWGSGMDKYVGKIGTVMKLRGVDRQGCAVVLCSFDGKEVNFVFRVRDMDLITF